MTAPQRSPAPLPAADDPARRIDWNWLDGVLSVDEAETELTAYREIAATEWYLPFHFPGLPIVPGVLLIEAMAHAAGVLHILRGYRRSGRLTHYVLAGVDGARFYRSARAGDRVELSARLAPDGEDELLVRASARLPTAKVARCEIRLHAVDAGDGAAALDRSLRGALRRVLPAALQKRYQLDGEGGAP